PLGNLYRPEFSSTDPRVADVLPRQNVSVHLAHRVLLTHRFIHQRQYAARRGSLACLITRLQSEKLCGGYARGTYHGTLVKVAAYAVHPSALPRAPALANLGLPYPPQLRHHDGP